MNTPIVSLKGLEVSYWVGTAQHKGFAKTISGAMRIVNRNRGNAFAAHIRPVFADGVRADQVWAVDLGFNGGKPDLIGRLVNGEAVIMYREF